MLTKNHANNYARRMNQQAALMGVGVGQVHGNAALPARHAPADAQVVSQVNIAKGKPTPGRGNTTLLEGETRQQMGKYTPSMTG